MKQSDFGIYFTQCKQHETEHGSGKNKIFSIKVLFLELSSYNYLFSTTLAILDIVDVCFSTVDTMLHVSGLLKLSHFYHMWALHSGTFRKLSGFIYLFKSLFIVGINDSQSQFEQNSKIKEL